MGIIRSILVRAGGQVISNAGFEAGTNGWPPNVAFKTQWAKDIYNESYRLGQEATKTKLMSAVAKKITDE